MVMRLGVAVRRTLNHLLILTQNTYTHAFTYNRSPHAEQTNQSAHQYSNRLHEGDRMDGFTDCAHTSSSSSWILEHEACTRRAL